MANKIAVIAVHGMGSFTPKAPGAKGKGQYSAGLAGLVRGELGKKRYDDYVHWREVYYGDILERNQKDLLTRLGPLATTAMFRDFVVENLGDPASYASRWDDPKNTIYRSVHDAIDTVLKSARKAAGQAAPVVMLAHSLGAKVVSNHIWDFQADNLPGTYVDPDCIAQFLTFGCNLPLFSFAFEYKDVAAINFPGGSLAKKFKVKPWWRNYYDRDDPLGFPLAPCGKGHADLQANGELEDIEIAAAGFIAGATPLSHLRYWDSVDFAGKVAGSLRALIDA